MLFFDLFRHDPNLVQLPQGELLFREGDTGRCMFVLLSGHATITRHERELERIGPGDIVGEIALLESSLRLATVRTLTDCIFASVDEARFRFLVEETPHFAVEVMRVMARRLTDCSARLDARAP